MKHKSHLTAISRKTLPAPTRWLIANGKIKVDALVLDYGCGKCGSVNPTTWDNYDPYYRPWSCWHKQCYKTIICNYVLCTLPTEERRQVLLDIQKKLRGKDAVAYVSVRNDKPKQGWGLSNKKTYQGRCSHVTDELVYKNSQFRIYKLTRHTRLI